jgi:hypothetical protein
MQRLSTTARSRYPLLWSALAALLVGAIAHVAFVPDVRLTFGLVAAWFVRFYVDSRRLDGAGAP